MGHIEDQRRIEAARAVLRASEEAEINRRAAAERERTVRFQQDQQRAAAHLRDSGVSEALGLLSRAKGGYLYDNPIDASTLELHVRNSRIEDSTSETYTTQDLQATADSMGNITITGKTSTVLPRAIWEHHPERLEEAIETTYLNPRTQSFRREVSEIERAAKDIKIVYDPREGPGSY